jgi:flavin reductase (DIM6/NTAB) family NADH-FMN oxidoreductase RutF
MHGWAAAVTLLTVADGRDDIGTTVSAFCPLSMQPAMVMVSLAADSYPAEVLGRGIQGGHPVADRDGRQQRFAITLLSAAQRAVAGRFAAAGRPGARLLLDGLPHRRGEVSGALIPEHGLAAIECAVSAMVPAGDHVVLISDVLAVPYAAESGQPLIRFRGGYPALG